jgi:NADH-quinone oxidoreductase subunit N
MMAMLATPEIFLALSGLILLVGGVFKGDAATPKLFVLTGLVLAAALVLLASQANYGTAFHGMFIADGFSRFVKIILLVAAILSLILAWPYVARHAMQRFEYPILILFATVGMLLMVSANNLMALYVGLELQSLALYVLASFRRDHAASSEAGLKYFVLGALSSGMLLYGISLLYGYTGSLGFETLRQAFAGQTQPALGVIFGLVFVCAGLIFKVSAVPFHMWTPDVYQGAPTPVTAFFAAGPKLAALALLTRVMIQPLEGLTPQWTQILLFAAVASMLLGALAGLAQGNLKRLMAYSSIANVGFALVGLVAGGEAGVQALLIYLAIYFLNTLGIFAVMVALRRNGEAVEQISDLSGLSKTHPMLALAMVTFMFSLAGVPPLAGFFGKYFVFLAAVKAGYVALAIIGVLASTVAAYYYLRLIKMMYFDEATAPLDAVPERTVTVTAGLAALAMVLFVFYPSFLTDSALVAAKSLFY